METKGRGKSTGWVRDIFKHHHSWQQACLCGMQLILQWRRFRWSIHGNHSVCTQSPCHPRACLLELCTHRLFRNLCPWAECISNSTPSHIPPIIVIDVSVRTTVSFYLKWPVCFLEYRCKLLIHGECAGTDRSVRSLCC